MKKYLYALGLITMIGLMGSCTDEADPIIIDEQQEVVATGENEGIEISVLSTSSLFVGYNSISIEITDAADNSDITDATVTIMPMMHMMETSHSCPVGNKTTTINDNGNYAFDVVFVMPTGEMNNWDITFMIEKDGVTKNVIVPITVEQVEEIKLVSFVSEKDESIKYFVALIGLDEPRVGENNLEVAVFKKATMMDWPAVEGVSFELSSWMTSMEHGSPNNVAPTAIGDGHYEGKVNFTMTGDWEIRLTMLEGDDILGTPVFSTSF